MWLISLPFYIRKKKENTQWIGVKKKKKKKKERKRKKKTLNNKCKESNTYYSLTSLKSGGVPVLEGKGDGKVEKNVHPYQLNGRHDMKVGKVPMTA